MDKKWKEAKKMENVAIVLLISFIFAMLFGWVIALFFIKGFKAGLNKDDPEKVDFDPIEKIEEVAKEIFKEPVRKAHSQNEAEKVNHFYL
jgi:preprotein translocase subunit SecF